jgi:two-component sensor histidine kinase
MNATGRGNILFNVTRKLPTAPITVYLIGATAVALLPLMLLSILLLSSLEDGRQQNTVNRSRADASFIARNINQQISGMDSTLRLLSDLTELKTQDYNGFERLAGNALAGAGYHAVVLTLDGTKIVDTSVQAELLPFFATISTELSRVLRQDQTNLSGFTYDAMTRSWAYYTGLFLSGPPEQQPTALLLIKTEKELEQLLSSEVLYDGWLAALLDEQDTIVATAQKNSLSSTDTIITSEIKEALSADEKTAIIGDTIYIKLPIPNRNWSVLLSGPLKPKTNIVSQAFTYLALGSLTIIIFTVLVCYFVSEHLRRSVRALSKMAFEVGEGKVVPPIETQLYELDHVARTLTTASYDRHLAQERSEIVLHELVHRSKNTIALLQAIMRQLSKEATSVEAYHKSVDQRLRGFAKSISELAVVEWSGLDLTKFVASHLDVFGDLALRVNATGPQIRISPTAAQNLGLVLHELMTNSIKHGALSQDFGTASIQWQIQKSDQPDGENRFIISWQDEGSVASQYKIARGFGSTIIERHAEYAFSGVVKIQHENGQFFWQLDCPEKNMLDSRPSSD